jgi:hypothetical protein
MQELWAGRYNGGKSEGSGSVAISRKTKRNAVIAAVLGILIGILLRIGADKQGAPYTPLHNWMQVAGWDDDSHLEMRDW